MGRIAGVSPAETKERLIDAAARVFELKGFEGATVAQIASEAGVTTGAIYAHYSGKAELLVDAVRFHGERATATLFPPGERTDTPSMLRTLGGSLGARGRADRALLAEAILGARRDPELAQVLSEALTDRQRFMHAVIADGQAKGELSQDISPATAARFSLMLGLGALIASDLDLPTVEPDEWVAFIDRIIETFTKGDQQ